MFEILRGRPKYIVQDTINIEKKMINVKEFFKKEIIIFLSKLKYFF